MATRPEPAHQFLVSIVCGSDFVIPYLIAEEGRRRFHAILID